MFARFSEAVRVFWSSAVLAKNALFNWLSPPMWIMQLFVISLFQIAFFVYVTKYVQNPDISVTYVAIGNALQSIAFVTVFAVCNITGEEKQQGTLVPILSTPANRMAMFVGRAMFQIVNGIATAVIALFYAAFLFGVDFSRTDMLGLGAVIVVTAFAMTGFGLMLSSIGLYLRTSMIVANIFLFIGLLFCGVNFPVSYLPTYLQPISYGIPMTFGTDAARSAVGGTTLWGISGTLGLELAVGLLAIFFGYVMFTLFENLSRRRGTMDRY
jgi:ABC-2 type transport system permease protein